MSLSIGRLAGCLERHTSGAIDFQYDPAWLGWEHTFPISLSLPLREDRHTGQPVIAVFDNLLPDSRPIRRLLAERVKAEGVDCFSLLAAVGRDCVGAMQFLPDEMLPGPAGSISAAPIGDDDIAGIVADLSKRPFGRVPQMANCASHWPAPRKKQPCCIITEAGTFLWGPLPPRTS